MTHIPTPNHDTQDNLPYNMLYQHLTMTHRMRTSYRPLKIHSLHLGTTNKINVNEINLVINQSLTFFINV